MGKRRKKKPASEKMYHRKIEEGGAYVALCVRRDGSIRIEWEISGMVRSIVIPMKLQGVMLDLLSRGVKFRQAMTVQRKQKTEF